ncbi:MAG: 7,8-didemethyl-8-hydroxy-5-deazariboflavin synthase CofG [Acidimicrobiia bacterium]
MTGLPDRDRAIAYLDGRIDSAPLFATAAELGRQGHGDVITYSRKVFIPLTTLCRDVCTYCTFAKPPGAGGVYLEPDEVMAVARAGDERGCTEALFTLGDRPEARWPQAREFLAAKGHESTLQYVEAMSRLVVEETGLFPHANPGVMSRDEIRMLRPTNVSMGMMLENISPRLAEPGMPHYGSPDKEPQARVDTIEAAGTERVPFTTGILVGIGENNAEIVDSLLALATLHAEGGQIQEVIIQNFRAKADTRMRGHAEPIPAWFARVVAVARWIFGPEMSIQVPPNLTERFESYLEAGINDWGGVSPLTIDFVNPEAPWPHLDELEARTSAAGFRLLPRLPVYPSHMGPEWIDAGLRARLADAADDDGFARTPRLEELSR